MNGYVKFFKRDKGWGMIEADDKQPDVFFHQEHIENGITPCEGNLVEFSLNPDYPKRRALQVIVLGKRSYGPKEPTPFPSKPQSKGAYGD